MFHSLKGAWNGILGAESHMQKQKTGAKLIFLPEYNYVTQLFKGNDLPLAQRGEKQPECLSPLHCRSIGQSKGAHFHWDNARVLPEQGDVNLG